MTSTVVAVALDRRYIEQCEGCLGIAARSLRFVISGELRATPDGHTGTTLRHALRKKTVDYGPSPFYDPLQNVRVLLTCFHLPSFVVKQYDEGQKRAEWLAILPIEKENVPDCTRTHEAREKVIKKGAAWSGYFKGVKDSLVFFNADDGNGGALPFVVYDSATGAEVFDDSAYDSNISKQRTENGP